MHQAVAVNHVVAIGLFACFAWEDVVNVAIAGNHHIAQFEILEHIGHHFGDAIVYAVLKAGQIHHDGFAVGGILQNLVEAAALWVFD